MEFYFFEMRTTSRLTCRSIRSHRCTNAPTRLRVPALLENDRCKKNSPDDLTIAGTWCVADLKRVLLAGDLVDDGLTGRSVGKTSESDDTFLPISRKGRIGNSFARGRMIET